MTNSVSFGIAAPKAPVDKELRQRGIEIAKKFMATTKVPMETGNPKLDAILKASTAKEIQKQVFLKHTGSVLA